MNKRIGLFAALIACAVLVLLPFTALAAEYKGVPTLKKGDYTTYTIDGESFFDQLASGAEEGFEYDIDSFSASLKREVTGEEKITIGGKSVDCYKVKETMKMEMVGSATMMGFSMDMEMKMENTNEMWLSKDGFVSLKEKEESYSYSKATNVPMLGDMESETESTSTRTLESVPDGMPETIKKGDSWTITADYTGETTEKSREKTGDTWGSWDEETYTSDGTFETTYNALEEKSVKVPAGTFQCIKIEIDGDSDGGFGSRQSDVPTEDEVIGEEEEDEVVVTVGEEEEEEEEEEWYSDDDDSEDAEYQYVSEDGMIVQYEYVNDVGSSDEAAYTVDLKSYQFGGKSGGGSKDEGGLLPGFEAVGLMLGGLAAVYVFRRRKK